MNFRYFANATKAYIKNSMYSFNNLYVLPTIFPKCNIFNSQPPDPLSHPIRPHMPRFSGTVELTIYIYIL